MANLLFSVSDSLPPWIWMPLALLKVLPTLFPIIFGCHSPCSSNGYGGENNILDSLIGLPGIWPSQTFIKGTKVATTASVFKPYSIDKITHCQWRMLLFRKKQNKSKQKWENSTFIQSFCGFKFISLFK